MLLLPALEEWEARIDACLQVVWGEPSFGAGYHPALTNLIHLLVLLALF